MKKFFGLIALLLLVGSVIVAFRMGAKKNIAYSDTGSIAPAARSVSSVTSEEPGLKIGDTAPDFKLKNVDGRMISLADIKNTDGTAAKGYIVAFTCNTCPYAVMYEDRIIDLHAKFAPKGWHVVAINPNDPEVKPGDSFDEMKVRAKEKAFPFVYLFDDGGKVFPQFGATRTPHLYVLDNSRKVRYIGALDNNAQDAEAVTQPYVENAIAAILAGKEPEPNFTKAIGCGIKAKS